MFANSWFSFLLPNASNPIESSLTIRASFTVRPAQAQDVGNVAQILAESFHQRRGIMQWLFPLLRLGIYEDLRQRLRSSPPYYSCLVAATDTNELAGTIEVTVRSFWQKPQYPYISNLAVKKMYRRQGAALQLLSSCERLVLLWGFEDMYLHVLENNYEAQRLYSTAGYRVAGVEHHWWDWLLGQPKRLFLHKHLRQA